MGIREAFVGVFTDDPVNWVKWAIVFAVLIGSYFIAIPLYKKVSYGVSLERKRDIARSRGHVIKASLVRKHPAGDFPDHDWRSWYRYSLDGGEREYRAFFKHPATPPVYLYLYYLDDPKKLFSYEEYHYENHKAVLLLPIILLPWVLSIAAMFLLGIERPG